MGHERRTQSDRGSGHVRFASKATELMRRNEMPLCANRVITRRSKTAPLFDRLIGNGE
jgi:hypothetical protein